LSQQNEMPVLDKSISSRLGSTKGKTMAQAKHGDSVSVNYTGKLDDGTVFDTTSDRYPMQFTIGGGQVIRGFEQAIVGMSPGESKTVTISVDDAYGPRNEKMVRTVDRDRLPADQKLEVGQRLQLSRSGSEGETASATITDISGESVTLDGNHPLAGKNLTFDIQLVEIM
jgi:peptidylprolyl isomerase